MTQHLVLDPVTQRVWVRRWCQIAREAERGRLVPLHEIGVMRGPVRRLADRLWVAVPRDYQTDPAEQLRIAVLMAGWWHDELSARLAREARRLEAERKSRNPPVGVAVPRRPKPTPRVGHGRGHAVVGAADDWTTKRRLDTDLTGGEVAQTVERRHHQ